MCSTPFYMLMDSAPARRHEARAGRLSPWPAGSHPWLTRQLGGWEIHWEQRRQPEVLRSLPLTRKGVVSQRANRSPTCRHRRRLVPTCQTLPPAAFSRLRKTRPDRSFHRPTSRLPSSSLRAVHHSWAASSQPSPCAARRCRCCPTGPYPSHQTSVACALQTPSGPACAFLAALRRTACLAPPAPSYFAQPA